MKHKSILIAFNGAECLMTGALYAAFKGTVCTLTYSDQTKETADVSRDMANRVVAYYEYANENGPYCDCPSAFEIVGAVQSARSNPIPNS